MLCAIQGRAREARLLALMETSDKVIKSVPWQRQQQAHVPVVLTESIRVRISGGGLEGTGAAGEAQKGVMEAAKQSAGGDSAGGVKVEGAAGGAESGEGAREQALTSEELLNKIQGLDEQIAATDTEITGLQASALEGEGAIFGMQVPKTPVKGKFACTLDAHGRRILEHNLKLRTKCMEAVTQLGYSASLSLGCSTPLYTCVEDSPYFQLNIERHKVVEPHIVAHLRRLTKVRRQTQLKQAAECQSPRNVVHSYC